MKDSIQRLWIRLTANQRQFWMLCATIAIGMLLWARLIVVSSMPRTAIADDPAGDAAGMATPVGNGGSENSSAPARAVQLDAAPGRDPFAVNDAFFPKPTQLDELVAEVEKSDAEAAEDSMDSSVELDRRLRDLVDGLALGVLMPDRAKVMIDGKIYSVGDELPAVGAERIRFRIIEIRHRAAVLEWESRTYELKMEHPGG